ncbi:hypothetical protein G6F57_008556 [Rhizopus arrhizus]|nr:hypothetical protein G6F31_013359 [Rhizopus arrhizus]KAG1362870.1 hypothetical protein G6F61_014090 [Rhizopus arrhizus]KAG1476764.1 hypothetical protein G6F57_008556 [Rhizopus arrhizus]
MPATSSHAARKSTSTLAVASGLITARMPKPSEAMAYSASQPREAPLPPLISANRLMTPSTMATTPSVHASAIAADSGQPMATMPKPSATSPYNSRIHQLRPTADNKGDKGEFMATPSIRNLAHPRPWR